MCFVVSTGVMPALSKWNNRINRWDGVTSIFLSLDRLHHKMFLHLVTVSFLLPKRIQLPPMLFHLVPQGINLSCAFLRQNTSQHFHSFFPPSTPSSHIPCGYWECTDSKSSRAWYHMVSMLSPVIALAAALGSRVLSPFPVATASGCGVPPARQNFAKWWTDIRPEISANVSWLSIWNQSRPKEDALVQHGCWFPAKESQSCQKKMNSEELQILCFKRLRNQASTAGTFFGTSSFTSS